MSLFKEKVIKDYILLLLCLFVQYVYCCLAGCENKKSRRKGGGFSAGLYAVCTFVLVLECAYLNTILPV